MFDTHHQPSRLRHDVMFKLIVSKEQLCISVTKYNLFANYLQIKHLKILPIQQITMVLESLSNQHCIHHKILIIKKVNFTI